MFYIKQNSEYIKQALSGNPEMHSSNGRFPVRHARLAHRRVAKKSLQSFIKCLDVLTSNIIAFHQISGSQSCARFQTNKVETVVLFILQSTLLISSQTKVYRRHKQEILPGHKDITLPHGDGAKCVKVAWIIFHPRNFLLITEKSLSWKLPRYLRRQLNLLIRRKKRKSMKFVAVSSEEELSFPTK